jgi:hypothetical protein
MKDKNGVLELWSEGGWEERRPPARRCVRRGHLFGVHASACSDATEEGNMLKHAHQTVTRRLFGVHALACSDAPGGGDMLKHAHQTVTRRLYPNRLFGVHASACSGSEPKGNMLKHAHPTLTRPPMKHRTPSFERRTLNWGRSDDSGTLDVQSSALVVRCFSLPESSIWHRFFNAN